MCRPSTGEGPHTPLLRGATGRLWQIQVQRSRIVTLKPARAWCSRAPLDGAAGTEQTACDRPAGATEIGRSDWEPWVHSQGSLLSGERSVTAGATVDGTRTGAVVESSVELTPSPHGSFLRHYHGPVFPHAARVGLDQFLRVRLMLAIDFCVVSGLLLPGLW